MTETRQQAERARRAFLKLSAAADRTCILEKIADALQENARPIFSANQRDLDQARDSVAPPLYKRLALNEPKLRDVLDGIRQIASMPDPVGRVVEETELDEELILRKVQTPIGVIAAIFESRPDVVPQIAALAIRTGNAVLLKGGREAGHTNETLGRVIRTTLEPYGLSDAIQMIDSREKVTELLAMDDVISLVVPRGSNEMVRHIRQNTKIPVLGHAEGICHIYVDEYADPVKAARITVDSKAQYPAVCNAAEALLVHTAYKDLDGLARALTEAHVELRGCPRAAARLGIRPAADSDFGREFGDLILAVKIVDSVDDAINHIHRYGSAHTDSIVTENAAVAERFLHEVDSAGVYWNASTRFADGFRYGFGAEVGVSTNRTHARGPVGVEGLLIYKYQLIGNGHIVATYVGENARKFTHRRLR